MNKLLSLFAISTLLAGCEVATGLWGVYKGDNAATTQSQPLTRAMVEASDLAVIAAKSGQSDPNWTNFIALANNNDTATFGRQGRTAITLRGGQVISQYVLGNDLTGVSINPDDPIQYPRPVGTWPASINRTYQLPGEGIHGDERTVSCAFQTTGQSTITIVEVSHDTTTLSETCAGDGLNFTNRYWVDQDGLVWKSEQWAGHNAEPLLIEVIEPLD